MISANSGWIKAFTRGLGLNICLSFAPPIALAWIFFLLYVWEIHSRDPNLVLLPLGLGLAGIAAGSFVVIRLVLNSVPPLHRLVEITGGIAHGDLDEVIPYESRNDEAGDLARALKLFQSQSRERLALARESQAQTAQTMRRAQSICALSDIFEQTVMAQVKEVDQASGRITLAANDMANRSENSGGRSVTAGEASMISVRRTAEVSEATHQLAESINEITHRVTHSTTIAQQAVRDVSATAGQMDELSNTVEGIGEVVRLISDIASQTNLLALNATIEAARAGDAGKGFAVVAGEVKNLAGQTARATDDITRQVAAVQASAKAVGESIMEIVNVIRSMEEIATAIAGAITEQESTTRAIAESVGDVATQSETVSSNIASLAKSSAHGCAGTVRVIWSARDLRRVTENLMRDANSFIERVRNADEFADRNEVFFRAVAANAAEISKRFERAVTDGAISMADLFDETYQPISGSNPQQYMTRFVEFTDRVLPEILEGALSISDQVVFSAAVDRNGFLPTHNKKFSQPQGGDPLWNDANCRNRRIFNDKTGLGAAKNTSPLLIQSYRRKLNDHEYMLMIDASAPIMVRNQHWGGLRLAFKA